VDPGGGHEQILQMVKALGLTVVSILHTHAHFDHIADVLPAAKRSGAQIIGIVELLHWLERKGAKNLSSMNKGGTQYLDGIEVTMVHADHSCGIQDGEDILYGGEAVGYVVKLEDGFTFYHAGDTNVFGDMAIIKQLYKPSMVFLPIGDHYTMGPREAALAVTMLEPRDVVPMHFGTFPILRGTPDDLTKWLPSGCSSQVHSLLPGERVIIKNGSSCSDPFFTR